MQAQPQKLLSDALEGHGYVACGVIARTSGLLDGEWVSAEEGDGFWIGHDEREAPVPLDEGGRELESLLVSITDEGEERMLAWVRIPEGSDVVGIGVDLCSTGDFAEDERGDHFARLLLTDTEKRLVEKMEGTVPQRRARVFSAKEAAFKATAAPLRRWYEAHDEELGFEVRDFELCSVERSAGSVARGTARSGRAERACELMGVSRIEVSFANYADMVLCVAVALRCQ